MATYVMLANFTDQGIKSVKDSVKRAEAFKDIARNQGVSVQSLFWCLGTYDVVAVADAPNDETITALGLGLAKAGNVRTQTLRAFHADEMSTILGKLA